MMAEALQESTAGKFVTFPEKKKTLDTEQREA